jgi:hypothetical protein
VILSTKRLDVPASVSETEPLVMRLDMEEPEPCSYVSSSWRFVQGRLTIVPFGTRHRNPECAKPIVTLPARISSRGGRPAEYDVELPMPLRVVVCQPWGDPLVRNVTVRQVARRGPDVTGLIARRDSMVAAVASGEAPRLDAIACAALMKGSSASSDTPP